MEYELSENCSFHSGAVYEFSTSVIGFLLEACLLLIALCFGLIFILNRSRL